MDKIKLGIIVDHLMQHGVERYTYEICKAIDKNKFSVTVYSLNPLNNHNNYYKPLLEEVGVEVKCRSNSNIAGKLIRLLFKILKLDKNKLYELQLKKELNKYDIISVFKIENYNKHISLFSSFNNLVLHVLSAPGQYIENPYIKLQSTPLKIVTMFEKQRSHVEQTFAGNIITTKNFTFLNLPLIINLNNRPNTYLKTKNDEPVIAIFSRISIDQPTIIMLIAFSLLLKKQPNAKLLFFGACYEEWIRQFYLLNCNILNISENVKFMGHVQDIEKSIVDNKITLGWMNFDDGFIGYSSIETISFGLPIVFFDVSISEKSEISEFENDKFYYTKDINHFVTYSNELLSNKIKRDELSVNLKNYIHSKYHVNKDKIEKLQQFYLVSNKA